MKSELIFAYGSNMDPAQMRERCPESDLWWFVAEARDWKLYFPRKSHRRRGGVGSITKQVGSSVWGVVFAVSERDLARLDRYEGVSSHAYRRDLVDLLDEGGRHITAWTYFAIPDGEEEYRPHRDYIAIYVRGAVYCGLPDAYLKSLNDLKDNAATD